MSASIPGQVQYINPEGLSKNPAFTQVITVTGPAKTIYIGGQDAVDASGTIVGKGNIQAQGEQAFKNIETALKASSAGLEHIVKWNIYVVQGQPLQPGFEAFQRIWSDRPNRPVITVMFVAGLAHPDFLVEVDAIAVVPE